MKNLSWLSCISFGRLAGVLWLVLSMAAVPALALSCNSSPVFAFSQSLYLGQYDTALNLLPRIKRERSSELAQFLNQVLVFKRAYERENAERQRVALKNIDDLIELFSKQMHARNGGEQRLLLANIMIHAARLHLAAGNVLRAASLARKGGRLLDQVLDSDPDRPDALLSNGLYFYYTGSESETLGWIMRWWSLQGDKVRGRQMIEKAVEVSADHAFEAARSLISDVAWNRQDTCRYAPLFSELNTLDARSMAAAREQIALALFCGQPGRVIQQIAALNHQADFEASALSATNSSWLFEAYVYALAAQGASQLLQNKLTELDPEKQQKRYWQIQFSLAKALDTQGAHQDAINLYREVVESDLGQRYRLLASAYQLKPYRKPRSFGQAQNNRLKFACSEND